MTDPFDRAERLRTRAEELRAIADGMREPLARALEQHARNLAELAVRMRGLRRSRSPHGAAQGRGRFFLCKSVRQALETLGKIEQLGARLRRLDALG